ncbi:hypothetical protein PIB30_092459 [Stylosanthes scabra]|uniref:Uncharacterized protein n=1 Tax=Stylosanthes scabra TaxID=79078 RepID=A0ABU6XXE2_9FABA|nr:hypothetical protein [Stylosanthes scabra]
MKRGVMEVDTMDAILTQNKAMAQQLTTLNKKLEKLEVSPMAKQLSTTLPNAFPSKTEDNPKGEYKAITLRSAKALEDVSKKVNVQPTIEKGKEDATREAKMQ